MSTIQKRFEIGDRAYMTPDAVENYGDAFCGVRMRVTGISNKYCPSNKHFAVGHSIKCTGHPGFDEDCGHALYDLVYLDSDDGNGGREVWLPLRFSLYDWELQ